MFVRSISLRRITLCMVAMGITPPFPTTNEYSLWLCHAGQALLYQAVFHKVPDFANVCLNIRVSEPNAKGLSHLKVINTSHLKPALPGNLQQTPRVSGFACA